MKTQITALIALASFTNLLFAGCITVVKVKLDEVAVDTPKRITGAVSKTGEEVTFDKKGGEYEPAFRRITGTAEDGERFIKSLKNLDSVRVIDPAEDSLTSISIGARLFHEYIRPGKTDEIASVVTRDSATHKFWNSGQIDRRNKLILGQSDNGTTLKIPLDSVAYVGVRKQDIIKTGLCFTGCMVVLTAVALYGMGQALEHAFDDAEWPYDN